VLLACVVLVDLASYIHLALELQALSGWGACEENYDPLDRAIVGHTRGTILV